MAEKNYTEVTIMGKSYLLGGNENEAYLQRVATYVNGRAADLSKTQGFLRQNQDYRMLMLIMNLADDYFKSQAQVEELVKKQKALEQELYSVKHELVSSKMRQEEG